MELKIEGVIRRITKPQEFTSGKRKCEIHVELANEKYEQIIPVEFWDDNVDEAIGLTVGATIAAKCYIRGREWRKDEQTPYRAFMSLNCFDYEINEKSIREQVIEKASNQQTEASDLPFDL